MCSFSFHWFPAPFQGDLKISSHFQNIQFGSWPAMTWHRKWIKMTILQLAPQINARTAITKKYWQ
jgi:hypothetical protein